MIGQAIKAGIPEENVEKLLSEENVSDFYLENLKIRLGIIEKKPERATRKVIRDET